MTVQRSTLDHPGPNLAAAMELYVQTYGGNASQVAWEDFRRAMFKLANRFERTDVIPEEAAHIWLEALGKPVPDPSCGRGT